MREILRNLLHGEFSELKSDSIGCIWMVLLILLTITIIACVLFISGLLFMFLWNWILPIFWTNAPILNIWQAVGSVLLLSFIGGFFKSSGKSD